MPAVCTEVEMWTTGSHGTQHEPLWRGGDKKGIWARRGWEAEETCQGKARAAGAGHFQYLCTTGIKCWWRESWSSEVTGTFLNRTPALEGILDITLPTITKPCGLCFPTISPVPPCSSSQISCLTTGPAS